MNDAAAKFFGCTDQDMDEYRAEQERNRPVDPKTLIKQQFVMSKTEAQPGKWSIFHISGAPSTGSLFFARSSHNPCVCVFRLLRCAVMKAATSASEDFQTSNSFYHKLTNESQQVMDQTAQSLEDYRRLIDLGVTEALATPWYAYDARVDKATKLDGIKRFAEEFIAPLQ